MKPRGVHTIAVHLPLSFALMLALSIAASGRACGLEAESTDAMDRLEPYLADQYRATVEQRRADITASQETLGRIDDTMRALGNELATENRMGRAKDLRARIEQLSERRSDLDNQIAKEQEAVSGAADAEKLFYSVAEKDLLQQQEERTRELGALDAQIASLEAQLNDQRGRQVRERSIEGQIEELSRRRQELASQPEISGEELGEPAAVENALASSLSERRAARREQLTSVRESIAELEQSLAREDRPVRRKRIEAQIAELSMKENELDIDPVRTRRQKGEGIDEHLQMIETGLKAEQLERARRADVLDQKAATLREKLRRENRFARRKSLRLQIGELEQQKGAVGKTEEEFQPPPTRGFVGAPYGSASDLDYEYQLPSRNK